MAPDRRAILKGGGLAAGALFLPLPYAWVWAQQADGALKLLKAPKVALVIGNGKYKDAPELKNAPNDAKAISEVLKGSGFAVTMLLDTGREALIQAIRDYVNAMAQKKSVGLFYFAGHGVQLDWRNYMLPIDAVIDKIEDVAKQSVDIARLMEGLTKAANPMNMIILDACRENPFGTAKQPAQKGLSQMDAPPHTILAYATSPGNVASDGDGVNGLYTENLLREMKVPEAKIEDIFKRVRLGVRRKTNGAQIPWESTSLEEDFWFLPPKEFRKRSDGELEKAFREELQIWEKIMGATDPGPFEDYLRRFPTGNYAELAQLQLDRALARQGEKKAQIAAQVGNPYTKGSAFTRISKVGDSFSYQQFDMLTGAPMARTFTHAVVQVTETETIHGTGLVTDLLGNLRRNPDGTTISPNQFVPSEFAVGKSWRTRYELTNPKGEKFVFDNTLRIAAREQVTVPAGGFNAFRLDSVATIPTLPGFTQEVTRWYVPEFQRPVRRVEVRKRGGAIVFSERNDLTAYKLA
jgi:hypothetical protein